MGGLIEPKQILFVSPFSYAVSGADESLLTILRALPKDRYAPHVALPTGSPYKPRFAEAGAQVHELTIRRLYRTINPFYWLIFFGAMPLELFRFWRLIGKTGVDVVHLNMESNLSAAIIGRLRRIPVIIHYRGNASDEPLWFFNVFLRLIYVLADHIFVISHAVGKIFFKRQLGERVEVLYNALDLSPYLAEKSREYFTQHAESFREKRVITYLGRLHPRKRVIDLINAAPEVIRRFPNVVIAIIGGDLNIPEEQAYRGMLETRVRELNLQSKILFLGAERNVSYALHSSDLFVLPSAAEGFGRTIIEAMAAGVPVIATDSGAFPELLKGGKYGRLYPLGRTDLLAAAINESLEDPKNYQTSIAAQAYAHERFDIVKHVARITEIYDELLC